MDGRTEITPCPAGHSLFQVRCPKVTEELILSLSVVTCITKVSVSSGTTEIILDKDKNLSVNGKEGSLPFIDGDVDVHEANEENLQVSVIFCHAQFENRC